MLTPSSPPDAEPPSSRKVWLAVVVLFLIAAVNTAIAVLLAPG